MILGKIPKYNKLTNALEGEEIALVPLILGSVKAITADQKTGYAIIHYLGGERLETAMDFTLLFSLFYDSGDVNTDMLSKVKPISKTFSKYINEKHGL